MNSVLKIEKESIPIMKLKGITEQGFKRLAQVVSEPEAIGIEPRDDAFTENPDGEDLQSLKSDPSEEREVVDRSTHETVVEYAMQILGKGRTPATAARATVQSLSGYENLFLGAGTIAFVDPEKLEYAILDRLADIVIENIEHVKEGMEHYALGGTMQQWRQGKAVRKKVKQLVIEKLGSDPFVNDDLGV